MTGKVVIRDDKYYVSYKSNRGWLRAPFTSELPLHPMYCKEENIGREIEFEKIYIYNVEYAKIKSI